MITLSSPPPAPVLIEPIPVVQPSTTSTLVRGFQPVVLPSPLPHPATASMAATASVRLAATPSVPVPPPWTITWHLGAPHASGSVWLFAPGNGAPAATMSLSPGKSPRAVLALPFGGPWPSYQAEVQLPQATASDPATASLVLRLPELPPPPPRPRALTILHTSDTYGVLDPIGYDPVTGQVDTHAGVRAGGKVWLARAVARERHLASDLLLLSAGNELGPDAEAAEDQGRRIVTAMNLMGYDAWSPSSYDFSYGLDALQGRLSQFRGSVVSSNVQWVRSGRFLGDRYRIFHAGGLKIAVLGLADPASAQLMQAGDRRKVRFLDPMEVVHTLVPRIRAQEHPDLVLALVHLPEADTKRLLTAGSGVDAVLGGFSAHRSGDMSMTELTGMRGKRAYSSGAYGVGLGRATFYFDPPSRTRTGRFRLAGSDADTLILDGKDPAKAKPPTDDPLVSRLIEEAHRSYAASWKARLGDVRPLSEELPPDDAMRFVAESMRWRAGTELAVVSRDFFLDGGDIAPASDIGSLYADMPWDEGMTTLTLSGSQLSDLYQTVNGDGTGVFAGLTSDDHGNLTVNGRTLDPDAYYSIAALTPLVSSDSGDFSGLANGANAAPLNATAKSSVLDFIRQDQGDSIGLDDIPDYSRIRFWKHSLTVDLNFQNSQVNVDSSAYPDLSWNTDQSNLTWGGEVLYKLSSQWGPDEADGKVDLHYEQQQVSDSSPSTTTDLVQLEANLQKDQTLLPVTTWGGVDLYTHFHQSDGENPFLMGQISAGLSQNLPLGMKLKEGLSYRKLFFDPLQRFGGLFRFEWNKPFKWVVVDTTLDVFGKPAISDDGILTDLEAKLTIPITQVVGISLSQSWYDDSSVGQPATRTLLGLSFSLAHPWAPPR